MGTMSTPIRALCIADDHLWSAGARTLVWPPEGAPVEIPVAATAFIHHRDAIWMLSADRLIPYSPAGEEAGAAITLPFVGLAMTLSGDHLAVAGDREAVALTWDEGWRAGARLALPGVARDVDVTADGARLVAVVDGDTLAMLDLVDGGLTTVRRKRGGQLSARFTAGGEAVLVGSSKERDLRLLPWGKQRMRRLLDGEPALAIATTRDRRQLVTHCGGEVQVIDPAEPRRQYTLRHYQDDSTAVSFGRWGTALGFRDGTVVRFALHNGAATPLTDPFELPERCLSRHRVSPRALGRTRDRLWMLSHNALLVEVTPARPVPDWKGDLPLAPHLPEYFHQHGQLLARGAEWWLLEGDGAPLRTEPTADERNLLRVFRADGEELWSLLLNSGRLAEAGGAYFGLGPRGTITRVCPSEEGPPVISALTVTPEGEAHVSPRFPPLPIGDGAFVLSWYARHQNDRTYHL